jgi:phosphate transport system substrate-binding protein
MVTPAFEALARVYESSHPEIRVRIVSALGSTGGIKAVSAGELDIAGVARMLKESEQDSHITYVPWYADGIVLLANPQLELSSLSLEAAEKIYKGQVDDWSDLGMAPGPVAVFSREPEDTIAKTVFKAYPSLSNESWGPHVEVITSDQRLGELVATTPGSVAFAPRGTLRALGLDVDIVPFEGVTWRLVDVRDGSYPMIVPLGLVTRADTSSPVAAFLEYLTGDEAREVLSAAGIET